MKGIGWVTLIVTFILVGVPLLMTLAMIGPEDYGNYCKIAIHMPCFGLGD
jgi:hypothetical protein